MDTHRPLTLRPARLAWGVVLTLLGFAGLFGVMLLIYGDGAAVDHWRIRIGLALATLGAGLAQVAILMGAWLIFSCRRDRR